jgi:hypothetical protein
MSKLLIGLASVAAILGGTSYFVFKVVVDKQAYT